MNIKIKYKLPKNYVALVYDKKVPRHFWRIAVVTGVLTSRDFEIKGEIVRIAKIINAILKCLVNNVSFHLKIHIMTLTK